MSDLICRQAAIDAVNRALDRETLLNRLVRKVAIDAIRIVPPVQPNVPEMNVGDMISRQAAMESLMAQNVIMDCSEYHNGFNAGVNRAQEVIRNLPQVQPKHGTWIPVTNGRGGHECDQCHNYASSYQNGKEHLSDFCPNCGADMRGEADG